MNQIMVDIEALGRDEDAAILTLGACVFNLESELIINRFYVAFDLVDVMRQGGTVSADTINWWTQQSDEARLAAFSGQEKLEVGLKSFSDWFKHTGCDLVWATAITYDIKIIEGSFKRLGLDIPWAYNAMRDARVFREFPIAGTEEVYKRWNQEPSLPLHHALADSIRQAHILRYQLRAVHNALK